MTAHGKAVLAKSLCNYLIKGQYGIAMLLLVASLCVPGEVHAQWVYSLGVNESTFEQELQRIHLETYEVVPVVTLSQGLGDIAFHPDGTLYGVSVNDFYQIDTTTGAVTLVDDFPSITFMVGLAIDHNGVFYVSAGSPGGEIVKYDPVVGYPELMGKVFNHMDLEFYNGDLYVAGILPASFGDRSYLMRVDTTDLNESEIVVQYEKWPGLALASWGDLCESQFLVSPSDGFLNFFDPPYDTVVQIDMPDPMNFQSAGATSLKSYLGSIPPLVIEYIDVMQNPCDTSGTATVQVLVGPGREGVEYSINGTDFQDDMVFPDIAIGTYQIYIRDDYGCGYTSDPFSIGEIQPFAFSFTTSEAHCGMDNGTLVVDPANALDSLVYSLDGSAFVEDPEFTGLAAGSYTLTVRDDNGCTQSAEVEIGEIDALATTASSTAERCGREDGTIALSASGGVPPYVFQVPDLPAQGDGEFDGLTAGAYTYTVIDALGCVVEGSVQIASLDGPEILDIGVSSAHCGMDNGRLEISAASDYQGLEFSIDGSTFGSAPVYADLPPGTYALTIRDSLGCTDMANVEVPELPGPVISYVESEDATCGIANGSIYVESSDSVWMEYSVDGLVYQESPLFENLGGGLYEVWIRDGNGCTDSVEVAITQFDAPQISDLIVSETSCARDNGTLTVHAQGGRGATEYAVDNQPFSAISSFTGLAAGTHRVYVRDEQGCLEEASIDIGAIPPVRLEGFSVEFTECGKSSGMIDIAVSKPPARVFLNGTDAGDQTVFTGLSSGSYFVHIEDAEGCTADTTVFVEKEQCGVYVPNIFSPNGDGVNDVFGPAYEESDYTILTFDVVSRWGSPVFSCSGDCQWDGKVQSTAKDAPSGVYIYNIQVVDAAGEIVHLTGDITILR